MERYSDDTPLAFTNVQIPYIIMELFKKHTIFNATYSSPNTVTPTRFVKPNGSYDNPMFESALHMAAAFGRVEIIDIMVGYITAIGTGSNVVIPVPSGDNGNKICAILRENGVTSMPRF
jgi:hypothetical protein